MQNTANKKELQRKRRHARVRAKISGTEARPRLSVFRSNKFVYAQIIDDKTGRTLVASNDMKLTKGSKAEKAKEVGKTLAELAKQAKILEVVFDRGGYLYAGRVKALAEGAREGGLKF